MDEEGRRITQTWPSDMLSLPPLAVRKIGSTLIGIFTPIAPPTLTHALLLSQQTQIGSTLIGIFGFGGYVEPRHKFEDCQFCGLSTGGPTPFFDSKVVPIAQTESHHTASVIGCT